MDFSLQGYLVFHLLCSALAVIALPRLVSFSSLVGFILLVACLIIGPLILAVQLALVLVTGNDDRPRRNCRHCDAERCAARHNRRHNDGR